MEVLPLQLEDLSDDVLLYIFGFLSLPDVIKARGICKRWAEITFESTLWRNMVLSCSDQQQQVPILQLPKAYVFEAPDKASR